MNKIFIVKSSDFPELIRILSNDTALQRDFNKFVDAILDFETPDKFDLKRSNAARLFTGDPFYNVMMPCLQTWKGRKGDGGTVLVLLIALQKSELNQALHSVNAHWEEKTGVAPYGFETVRKIAYQEQGVTYRNLFENLADTETTELRLEDTYSSSPHQVANFQEFVRTAKKELWPSLKKFTLRALAFNEGMRAGLEGLIKDAQKSYPEIKFDLLAVEGSRDQVTMEMHDRFLRIGNSWEVHLGRGLDIYEQQDGEYRNRSCKECNVIYVQC